MRLLLKNINIKFLVFIVQQLRANLHLQYKVEKGEKQHQKYFHQISFCVL